VNIILVGGPQDGLVLDLAALAHEFAPDAPFQSPKEIAFPVATGKIGITEGSHKRQYWNSTYLQTEDKNADNQTVYKYKGLEKA
jgi:hypothetical protein